MKWYLETLPRFSDGFDSRIPLQLCSCSTKAVHFLGKDETLDRYQPGAPHKPIPTTDVTRVPGLSFYTTLAQLDQSTCLRSRGPGVRISQVVPYKEIVMAIIVVLVIFVVLYFVLRKF